MKTIPAVHDEDLSSLPAEEEKAKELYMSFLTASGQAAKLEKKLLREESKCDRLGFPPKKIRKLAAKLQEASSRKYETLAELSELRIA